MKKKINAISSCLLIAAFSIYTIVVLINKYNENEKANQALLQAHIDAIISSLTVEKEAMEASRSTVELTDQSINRIKNKYSTRVYMKTGFLTIFGTSGFAYIHPTEEGKNVSKTFFGARILSKLRNEGNFDFTDENTRTGKVVFYKFYKPFNSYVAIILNKSDFMSTFWSFASFFLIATSIILLSLLYFSSNIASYFSNKFQETDTIIGNIQDGNYTQVFSGSYTEAEQINDKLTSFYSSMTAVTSFAKELAQGNLNAQLKNASQGNKLAQHLAAIQSNIKQAKNAEEQRKVEDEKLNWVNHGLAKFGELLRVHTETIEAHCDIIIQNLVKYVNANQGGIYLIDNENRNKEHIALVSAFAFDTKKYIKRRYAEGEGLLGTCALEKQTIYITDVPDDYIEITSGLGHSNPRSILISPIINEDEILGLVELASFNKFQEHEIKFVEKILESVAATLKTAKINAQTSELIHKFELQKKEMADNEEMMQQNIEEFKAAQEESESKEYMFMNYAKALAEQQLLIEYNETGQVIHANDNFIALVGKENKQLIMTNIKDHQHLKFACVKDIAQLLDDMQNNKKYETVSQYDFKGNVVWLKETYVPVRNAMNKMEKILRICTDISSSRINEDKLQELQAQLESSNRTNEDLLKAIKEKDRYYTEIIEQLKQNPS